MKILHVLPSLEMGGAEKLVVEMASKLNMRYICDVFLFNGASTPLKEALLQKGINVIDAGTGSVYNPLLIIKLISIIKHYDIIHCHLFTPLYFVGIATRFVGKNSPKLIYTEHNTSNKRMRVKGIRLIERLIYSFYHKIICITREVHGVLLGHLGRDFEHKMSVIPNGVDVNAIIDAQNDNDAIDGIKKEISYNTSFRYILQVSSFREAKDQDTVIRALQYLPDNTSIIFLGTGKRLELCKRLAIDLQVSDRVHFMGVRQNVTDYFQIADFVVLSSHYEGLSLASIEGLASGKPFIASDVPGLHEIVNGAGVLFECGNARQLSMVIRQLMDDLEYADVVGRRGRERARLYDLETMTQKYIDLYHEMM